jgi:hypothetical protein
MGVILIRLISNPIHAEIQEEDEILRIVPIIKEGIKIKYLVFIKIIKVIFYFWETLISFLYDEV